jgi:hypothetical protein
MAGKEKYAQRMAAHLGEPVDGACPITRPGGSAAQMGMAAGGLVGAAIASRGGKDKGDIAIPQAAWLGLTQGGFAVSKASFMGKPTGEPLLRAGYAEVADVTLTEGKITLRADLLLHDGRHVAFEAKRLAAGKESVEVIELLRARCTGG